MRRFLKRFVLSLLALCGLWIFYALTPAQNLEKLDQVSRMGILPNAQGFEQLPRAGIR